MLMDIVMSVVTYYIATFQGFLNDFTNGDSESTWIMILKMISLVVFLIRLCVMLITIDYEDDVLYEYITDIVKKELRGGGIFLHMTSLIMVVISLIFTQNQAVGIIFFFASLLKLISVRSNLRIL